MFDRLRADYGAGPLHAVVLLVCFTIGGWVVFLVSGEATVWRMVLWFVGAAVVHDLLLFPVYAAADRGLRRLTGTDSAARRALLNHLRVPALASALLFLLFLPGILNLGQASYQAATGQPRVSLVLRWLAVSGALFALSGVALLIRWSAGRRGRSGGRAPIGRAAR